jgi:hypothetical protein
MAIRVGTSERPLAWRGLALAVTPRNAKTFRRLVSG